jgi:hypothetical protein
MSTLKKGIKKIYNFHLNVLSKFGTQNLQNAIDLVLYGLTDTEQNLGLYPNENNPNHQVNRGEEARTNHQEILTKRVHFPLFDLITFLLSPLTRWTEIKEKEGMVDENLQEIGRHPVGVAMV